MNETKLNPSGNLPLSERPIDIFFIVIFSLFCITSIISDMVPVIGVNFNQRGENTVANWNYWYAHENDLLFQNPPAWKRIIVGLSAFVYMPFYIVLVISLWKGWNRIQLPCVIYATMIATLTGIVIYGVQFWPEPVMYPNPFADSPPLIDMRCQNPAKFLVFNTPYVLLPILLLIRMRKPMPFNRKF